MKSVRSQQHLCVHYTRGKSSENNEMSRTILTRFWPHTVAKCGHNSPAASFWGCICYFTGHCKLVCVRDKFAELSEVCDIWRRRKEKKSFAKLSSRLVFLSLSLCLFLWFDFIPACHDRRSSKPPRRLQRLYNVKFLLHSSSLSRYNNAQSNSVKRAWNVCVFNYRHIRCTDGRNKFV